MPWNPLQMRAARREPVTEQRAITDVPWVPWDIGGPARGAVTQASALRFAPVYAAVRHIADTIATLPIDTFRRIDNQRREPMSSLPRLFRDLANDGALVDWFTRCFTSLALRGNAVGLVTARDELGPPNEAGFPTAILWLPMDNVSVDDSGPIPTWYVNGAEVDRSDIVHIPWITIPGRTLGLSPIESMKLAVDAGVSAQEFGTGWFDAGGIPPGVFQNIEKTLTQEEVQLIKARYLAAVRTRTPIVYGKDWKSEWNAIPPEQAQFIETIKASANMVAAIYGIDPTEIGGEAANALDYKNEEHRQITRMHNLRPWMVRVEAKLSAELPERQFVKFNADATIRADTLSRHEVYRMGREIGLYSVDELRALEDLPPLPSGAGQDYTPLGKSTPAASPSVPSLNGQTQEVNA